MCILLFNKVIGRPDMINMVRHSPNGEFTLPDTETDTDKMCTEPMEICTSLVLGVLGPL